MYMLSSHVSVILALGSVLHAQFNNAPIQNHVPEVRFDAIEVSEFPKITPALSASQIEPLERQVPAIPTSDARLHVSSARITIYPTFPATPSPLGHPSANTLRSLSTTRSIVIPSLNRSPTNSLDQAQNALGSSLSTAIFSSSTLEPSAPSVPYTRPSVSHAITVIPPVMLTPNASAPWPPPCACDPDAPIGFYCGYCADVTSCRDNKGCRVSAFACGTGGVCRGFGMLDFCYRSAGREGEQLNCPLFVAVDEGDGVKGVDGNNGDRDGDEDGIMFIKVSTYFNL
ncbi:hypothetical protein P280DRAFT_479281 [Massarina eburnea CBS 473.64]|uniref:Chitin-binding type-1 domain-containing protein n=1 Tax=Massarina eburnea CBS 473.64 TaxID=1395130 RepID=A0A6A6S4K7_9PLEO|nr:hypothetical protein P280DRAFT_479281 [Massarina eburnea CBS 473.64]